VAVADWPLRGAEQRENGTAVLSLTHSGFTKGAWNVLFASAPFDAGGIILTFGPTTVTSASPDGARWWVDLGIGAASAEVVLLADLLAGPVRRLVREMVSVTVPLAIKAGTRITLRCTPFQANAPITVTGRLISTAFLSEQPLQAATTYGVNAGQYRGIQLTAPGSPGVKSAWTELVAASDRARAVLVGVQKSLSGTVGTLAELLLDIGVGAAGSEQVLLPDLGIYADNTYSRFKPWCLGPYAADLPAGTRLAARYQRSAVHGDNLFLTLTTFS
jgi:hypothetical protein